MKKIIIIGFIIMFAIFVYAELDIYFTQQQLDNLNISQINFQTLQCASDGKIQLEGENIITYYNCSDMEVIEGLDAPYHFYTGEFNTAVPLSHIQTCLSIPDICSHARYYYLCWSNETYYQEFNESCEYCLECENCTTLEWCENFYWDKVLKQALENVNSIIHNIEIHQTGYGDDNYSDWEGDIFE